MFAFIIEVGRYIWLTLVVPGLWEAEIGRIIVQGPHLN